MRILYIDIDSLRPDHLGCYGYARATSPHIDGIAAQGVRFDNCYATDVPCLPSRTALFSGRFGIHTGVINHGGVASQPFIEGARRGFKDSFALTGWMSCLQNAGLHTVTVSPFGQRHSAWHWYASFNEIYNTGKNGYEGAEEISPVALDWIARNGSHDDWFLHVNLWDPHGPFRAPAALGEPFAAAPLPSWYTPAVRRAHWEGAGPHCAQDLAGFDDSADPNFPRQPSKIDSMEAARAMFDGYDTGILYADEHCGRIFAALERAGVLDETVIIISADHGENLGELNIYCDHQTADNITARVPMIVRWPGVTDARAGQSDDKLRYQFDVAATTVELAGARVPANWDGVSFAANLENDAGRPFLVLSQGAWSCQRAVRWDDYLLLRSYHDGYHGFPEVMLFNVRDDPHEQHDVAASQPALVAQGQTMLDQWHAEMMRTAAHPHDPMQTVLSEGGPLHTRGQLPAYLRRLRATGRAQWADRLAARHPDECVSTP